LPPRHLLYSVGNPLASPFHRSHFSSPTLLIVQTFPLTSFQGRVTTQTSLYFLYHQHNMRQRPRHRRSTSSSSDGTNDLSETFRRATLDPRAPSISPPAGPPRGHPSSRDHRRIARPSTHGGGHDVYTGPTEPRRRQDLSPANGEFEDYLPARGSYWKTEEVRPDHRRRVPSGRCQSLPYDRQDTRPNADGVYTGAALGRRRGDVSSVNGEFDEDLPAGRSSRRTGRVVESDREGSTGRRNARTYTPRNVGDVPEGEYFEESDVSQRARVIGSANSGNDSAQDSAHERDVRRRVA
jgi:hypothetical protein